MLLGYYYAYPLGVLTGHVLSPYWLICLLWGLGALPEQQVGLHDGLPYQALKAAWTAARSEAL